MYDDTPVDKVYRLIKDKPGITGRQLRNELSLPRRTLYVITKRLITKGYIIKLNALKDARMYKYYPVGQ